MRRRIEIGCVFIHDSIVARPDSLPTRFDVLERVMVPFDFLLVVVGSVAVSTRGY